MPRFRVHVSDVVRVRRWYAVEVDAIDEDAAADKAIDAAEAADD